MFNIGNLHSSNQCAKFNGRSVFLFIMNAFVAITDNEWFHFLASHPGIVEINFWQPGGKRLFSTISPNELFLFKLHSPENFIVGGGFFEYASLLPVSLAWETFKEGNGASSFDEMRRKISGYRHTTLDSREDYQIGCILLATPFYFQRDQWIPVPADFSLNIMTGKRYDLTIEPGSSLYRKIQERLSAQLSTSIIVKEIHDERLAWGSPVEIFPRLGQGAFRVMVIDAYHRRCAVSGERVLPVLVASHIKPYSDSEDHNPSNGILLRSDLHTLFDRGYVTVTPEYSFEVSRHIREDFDNGKDYYALQGRMIQTPDQPAYKPSRDALAWHNENIYLG